MVKELVVVEIAYLKVKRERKRGQKKRQARISSKALS